jgi:monoamine oxidase
MAAVSLFTSGVAPAVETAAIESDTPRPIRIDEDESSLSSTGSDLFDRNKPPSKAHNGTWEVDVNGDWRRYSSLESATSTAISSMCSSTAADDFHKEQNAVLSPSRKRMSDGTVKQATIRLSSKTSNAASTPQSIEHVADTPEQATFSVQPKRRGRPPKDKSVAPNYIPSIRRPSMISKLQDVVKPRSSIPYTLPITVFASQCLEAAHASRLDPYALHVGENALLMDMITSAEVTVYLNIRNAILRLWVRNPRCSITVEEAAGCAKEGRFFGLAEVAYKWLTRNGYINFGCVDVPHDPNVALQSKKFSKQKTVVVVGAGVSGLTTARQLEGLFAQYSEHWLEKGERPPKVLVIEGRKRVGGRVYSKPLRSQVKDSLPNDLRNTAEMGAMIVTGFDHGNPLDTIIRGQLGLHYHLMTDALTIYDTNGKAVKERRDMLNTDLYTDITDRAGDFRAVADRPQTLKGDEELISRCRDPLPKGFDAFQLEPLPSLIEAKRKAVMKRGRRRNAPPGTEKLTGRHQVVENSSGTIRAARAAHAMGWKVRDGVSKNHTLTLRPAAEASRYPTLGAVMDEAISQYQGLLEMTAQDMRLLNWHHANLEYANAAPVPWLSLSGHDQDTGNEFEGAHSEVVGGYTQVPRGLMNLPTKLDVRFDRIVDSIHYDDGEFEEDESLVTKIVCTNGEVIEADEVVLTTPLGVLKSDAIDFDPPLPSWKQGAIDRMGFGLLNKVCQFAQVFSAPLLTFTQVILLYDEPFWDDSRDMFGLLNEAERADSLDPKHYEQRRGRFYLIWNATKTSGRPMLIALMAGHAAYQAEETDTETLMEEVTQRLRQVFSPSVPAPREVIVTRWKSDPFTRGTYSYVGPRTRPQDYDVMARSVGNLHFAGEATCGTHPATVHGAFLSGLRVAADVMDVMVGPINLPEPLVGSAGVKKEAPSPYTVPAIPQAQKPKPTPQVSMSRTASSSAIPTEPVIKQEPDTTTGSEISGVPRNSVCSTDQSFWASAGMSFTTSLDYEAALVGTLLGQIGERPEKPQRAGVNPFLLFTKAKWDECRAHCAADPVLATARNAIRTTLGQWWKALSDADKQPYLVQSQQAQEIADAARKQWAVQVVQWDADAARIRADFAREHPPPADSGGAFGVEGNRRKTNVSSSIALDLPM